MLFRDVTQPLLLPALVLRCTVVGLSSCSGSFEPRLIHVCVLVKHKLVLYRGLTYSQVVQNFQLGVVLLYACMCRYVSLALKGCVCSAGCAEKRVNNWALV